MGGARVLFGYMELTGNLLLWRQSFEHALMWCVQHTTAEYVECPEVVN